MLAFKAERDRDRARQLDELARLAQECGGYEEPESTMRTYTTFLGTLIEYPAMLPDDVEAFLRRAQAALDDPTVDESAMMTLLFGTGNPILDQVTRPDGTRVALINREVAANPLYAVCQDMMFRKHRQASD